jgi:hypothetical protein
MSICDAVWVSQRDELSSVEAQPPEWLARRRSVVVLFIEATILPPPERWEGWCEGPLQINGYDGRGFVPAPVWSVVVGSESRPRRWHIDLEQRATIDGTTPVIIAVEAMKLTDVSRSSYLLAVHIRMKAVMDHDEKGLSHIDSMIKDIPAIVGAPTKLHQDWSYSKHSARASMVAELVCVPDDSSFLPEPSYGFSNLRCPPGHLEMFSYINQDVVYGKWLVSAELVQAASSRVIQFPNGEIMVGLNRSVAAADFGEETFVRTVVADAFYLILAQRVSLRRLAQQGESLTNPGRNLRTGVDFSRGIVSYLSLHSWARTIPPSPIAQIILRYRELSSADILERELQIFSGAVQTQVSTETNLLLTLLTNLGVAVAVAAAVLTGAQWHGVQILWSLGVALLSFAIFSLLPFGRPIRQGLTRYRSPRHRGP